MLEKDHSKTILSGKKLSKAEPIFEVLGNLDELIAVLGLARSFSKSKSEKLKEIQEDLLQVGGFLANTRDASFLDELILKLREEIREEKRDLTQFVIPKRKLNLFFILPE